MTVRGLELGQRLRIRSWLLILATLTLVIAACSAEQATEIQRDGGATDTGAGPPKTPQASDAGQVDFPVGPAVLVSAAYVPPTDRVDATGGYLPVNGKPTLVYAESIT